MSLYEASVKVNGYRRDPRGIWRYEANGMAVPAARDVTVRRLWRFPSVRVHEARAVVGAAQNGGARTDGLCVAVPTEVLTAAPELGFCRAYLGERTQVAWAGRRVDAVLVPAVVWEEEADRSLGIDAPELAAHRLLDVARIAALLGARPTTVRSYVQRGYLPKPTVEGLSFPLWAVPPLLFALRARTGQGVAQPGRTTHRSTRTPHRERTESSAELLARLDAELSRLIPADVLVGASSPGEAVRRFDSGDSFDDDDLIDLTDNANDDGDEFFSDRYRDNY